MIVHSIVVGALQVNCYILGCEKTGEAALIDPGDNASAILNILKQHNLQLVKIINTHAHFDHILAVNAIKAETNVPFLLHQAELPIVATMRERVRVWLGYDPGEPPVVDGFLTPGEVVRFGQQELEMRFTPGHSPGSITFVDHVGRRAFTGDALFAGSVGRTDLPGGNLPQLLAGIQQEIMTLPDDFVVLPGHGPKSTVGRERQTNPFLQHDHELDS